MVLWQVCENGSLFDLYCQKGKRFDPHTALRLGMYAHVIYVLVYVVCFYVCMYAFVLHLGLGMYSHAIYVLVYVVCLYVCMYVCMHLRCTYVCRCTVHVYTYACMDMYVCVYGYHRG
jgi:hypothetical protein